MIEFILISIVVTVIVFVSFIFGVKKSYKISKASCAHDYLDQQTIKYRQKSDTYIKTYTSKVKISSDK